MKALFFRLLMAILLVCSAMAGRVLAQGGVFSKPDSVWMVAPIYHNEATVSWNAVTGAVSYEVSWRFNAVDTILWDWEGAYTAGDTVLVIPDLIQCHYYQVRVRAMREDSVWSAYTSKVNFKTAADTNYTYLDRFPTNVQVSNVTPHSFEITWDTLANDTAGYFVYLNWAGDDPWTPVWTDTNYLKIGDDLFPNQDYRFVVTETSTYNWHSVEHVAVHTDTAKAQPRSFRAINSLYDSTKVILKWHPPVKTDGLVSYQLFWHPETEPLEADSISLSSSTHEYTVTGLNDTVRYAFKIRAVYADLLDPHSILVPTIQPVNVEWEHDSLICAAYDDLYEGLRAGKVIEEIIPDEAGDCSDRDNYTPYGHFQTHTIRINFHFLLRKSPKSPLNFTPTGPGLSEFNDKLRNTPISAYDFIRDHVLPIWEAELNANPPVTIYTSTLPDNPTKAYKIKLADDLSNTNMPGDPGNYYQKGIYFHEHEKDFLAPPFGSSSTGCDDGVSLSTLVGKYAVNKESVHNIFMGFKPFNAPIPNTSNPVRYRFWPADAPRCRTEMDGYVDELGDMNAQYVCHLWSSHYRTEANYMGYGVLVSSRLDPIQSVPLLSHELGHSLGLDHSYGDDSCEDTPPGPKREWNSGDNNIMAYGSDKTSLTPNQLGVIHKNLVREPWIRYLMPDFCDYDAGSTITIEDTEDVTWNSRKLLKGDVVVKGGGKLTINCTVHFPAGARLIIERGGLVELDGGTLTNLCDGQMWDGVEIWGKSDEGQNHASQGKIVIDNYGTIEHAKDALSFIRYNKSLNVQDWNYTGGIVECFTGVFRNNRRDAQFLLYEEEPSASYFYNSNFECTGLLKDTSFYPDKMTGAHISIYAIDGVDIAGCHFINSLHPNIAVPQQDDELQGKGIYANEANLLIENCYFNNLHCGIEMASSNFYDGGSVIRNCDFEDVWQSIRFTGANSDITIESNEIVLTNPATSTLMECGINLTGAYGVNVLSNEVHGSFVSLYLEGVFPDYADPFNPIFNDVRYNTFELAGSGLLSRNYNVFDLNCNYFLDCCEAWLNEGQYTNNSWTVGEAGSSGAPLTNFFEIPGTSDCDPYSGTPPYRSYKVTSQLPDPNPFSLTTGQIELTYYSVEGSASGRCGFAEVQASECDGEATSVVITAIDCDDEDDLCGEAPPLPVSTEARRLAKWVNDATSDRERKIRTRQAVQSLKVLESRTVLFEDFFGGLSHPSARWAMAGYYIAERRPQDALNIIETITPANEDERTRLSFIRMLAQQRAEGRHPRLATSSEVALAESIASSLHTTRYEACAFLKAYDGRDCFPFVPPVKERGRPVHTSPSPLNATTNAPSFDLYPNPAQDAVHLRSNANETATFEVHDLTGRLMLRQILTKGEATVDVSAWPAGVYLWKWTSNSNALETGKLILSK